MGDIDINIIREPEQEQEPEEGYLPRGRFIIQGIVIGGLIVFSVVELIITKGASTSGVAILSGITGLILPQPKWKK